MKLNCSKPFAQNGDQGRHRLLLLDSIRPQTAAYKMTDRQTPVVKFCKTQVIVQNFLLLIFMFEPLNKSLICRGLADDDVHGRVRVWLRASTTSKFYLGSIKELAN
jgi:hypothetical protein